MILAGVDVFRLNFSRGSASHHLSQAQTIRVAAKSVGREVGIVADLQGLKIRIGKFIGDRVRLDHFRINAQHVG